jgi:hypothetical protein
MVKEHNFGKYSNHYLGNDLTTHEWKFYGFLRENGIIPISYNEISARAKDKLELRLSNDSIIMDIFKIRRKLGQSEIINIYGKGYVSRREIILEAVARQITVKDILNELKEKKS